MNTSIYMLMSITMNTNMSTSTEMAPHTPTRTAILTNMSIHTSTPMNMITVITRIVMTILILGQKITAVMIMRMMPTIRRIMTITNIDRAG